MTVKIPLNTQYVDWRVQTRIYRRPINCLNRVASWINKADKHSLAKKPKKFAAAGGAMTQLHSWCLSKFDSLAAAKTQNKS